MKTLLLNPPSFEKFDGGAGSRYQATREITSFWYPVWLAYPAGSIRESRLLDAPADGVTQSRPFRLPENMISLSFLLARQDLRTIFGWLKC